MQNQIFSVTHLEQLVNNKQYDDANSYISSFFFKSGIHIYFRDGEKSIFTQYELGDAKKLIPDDLIAYNKKAVDYDPRKYLSSTKFMANNYNTAINFQTDAVSFEKANHAGMPLKYLNMAKPMTNYSAVEAKREDFAEDLDIVCNHIKVVWANNNEEMYEWIMNFNACTLTGKRKLRKALYLPCDDERAGRGSILNFFNKILGPRMLKTSSVETIMTYTKDLEGTCCVNVDELPAGDNFKSVNDQMKSLITEPTFTCRDMYSKGYSQVNTFNFYITTNNHNAIVITLTNNKRFAIAQVNVCMVGKAEYFTKLHEILNKPEVQKLFYEDMVIRFNEKCVNWNEDNLPVSEVKTEKLIESLPFFTKWFKENYALKKKNLNTTTNDFFEEYYRMTKDKTSKQKISKILGKLGIESISKKKGEKTFRFYIKTGEEIYEAYKTNNWIDDSVEFADDSEEPEDPIETGVDKHEEDKHKMISMMKQKDKEIEELMKQLLAKNSKTELVEEKPAEPRKLVSVDEVESFIEEKPKPKPKKSSPKKKSEMFECLSELLDQ